MSKYLSDDEVFGGGNYLSDDEVFGRTEGPRVKFTPSPAPSKERTWGQAAADTGVQLAEGVNTVLGAIPNLVAPESRVAQFFDDNARFWRERQSDPLKARIAVADKAITAAGEDGVIAQVAEAASQYFTDPALAARFVTTNLPSMIPGVAAAKVAQGAALARGASAAKAASVATTAGGATSAALNAGGARGEAFDDIKRTLIDQGLSPEEAEQKALTDSRVAAAVGALAGFVSGKTGLESAVMRQTGAKGAVKAGLISGAVEAGGEQIEEVAPKITTNLLAGQYDDRSPLQDVGRTMVETAIGAGPGTALSGGLSARDALSRQRAGAPAPAPAAAAPLQNEFAQTLPELEAATTAYVQPSDITKARTIDEAVTLAEQAANVPLADLAPPPELSVPSRIPALREMVDRDAELTQQIVGGLPRDPQPMLEQAQRLESQATLLESDPAADPATLRRADALRNQAQALATQAAEAAAIVPPAPTVGLAADVAGLEAQRQANLELRAPARQTRAAEDFVDLKPMEPMEARQRLTVLRDQLAEPLTLQIVSHPSEAGKLAIARAPLPLQASDLELSSPAPQVSPAAAQQRLESAALAGAEAQRRAEDAPRQDMISRTMAAIEERGGVASPYEAELLRAANLGQPYNRIDPSLGRPASTDEQLTAATGVAVGQEAGLGFGARESTRQQPAAPAFEYTPDMQGRKAEQPAAAPEVSIEQAFVQQMRETNTPAARAFVKDYEAGRISDADVTQALETQRALPASAQERIEGAAAQAQPEAVPTGVQVQELRSRGVNPVLAEAVTLYGNRPLTQQDLTVEGATSRIERAASQAPSPQAEGVQVETGYDTRAGFRGRNEAIRTGNNLPRPARVGGVLASSLTDEQLRSTAGNENLPAITRRGAQIELLAREQEQRAAAPAAVEGDVQSRLEAAAAVGRLAESTPGRIITSGAKLSTQRAAVPGTTLSFRDGDTEQSARVVDVSQLGDSGKMLTQVARIFGKKLVVFESDTLKADGFVMDDDSSSVYVNAKSTISPVAVFGHELTHLLKRENAAAYTALETVVSRSLKGDAMQKFGQEYGADANLEELTSDLMGNRFQEPEFWSNVFDEIAAQNPTEARGIITRLGAALRKSVNAFMKVVRQSGFRADEYVTNLENVKAAAQTALVQYAQQQREPAARLEMELAKAEQSVNLQAAAAPAAAAPTTPAAAGPTAPAAAPVRAPISEVEREFGLDKLRMSAQRQTETPEFRQFYEGSQIRTGTGKPVMLFRGMRGASLPEEGVESFTAENGLYGEGIYMSSSPRRSEGYTKGERGQMYPVFAAVKNPIDADEFVERFGRSKRSPAESKRITDQLIAEGYDGVVERGGPGGFIEVMAFRPEQVKSVFNERPTSDPRITKSPVREKLRAQADAIAAMDADTRDNMEVGQFDGGGDAYNLYEARKLAKKPSNALKRVTDSNSFNLWTEYDFVANVDGELIGVNKDEDPDDADDDTKFVYSFQRLEDPQGSRVVTTTDQIDELFKEVRAGKGSASITKSTQRDWKKSDAADIKKAEVYQERTGMAPYTSEGQISVPLEGDGTKYSVKRAYGEKEFAKGRANDPLTGLPLNKNGTVTLYFPTSNAVARELAKTKKLTGASPNANRIYLTNESSGPKVMNEPGNIDHKMDGANVLLQVDPRLLHLDKEYPDGRKDFFIPVAEGEAYKTKMTKLFTLDAPRTRALSKDVKLTDLQTRIGDSISEYLQLDGPARKARLEQARQVLKDEHNVGTLLGVNGKLEKTNTGGYGLNNYNGKDVMSMGLGLASAQKINEKNLSTCPNSAICEGLCLGETSGQNLLYGGEGQFKSGPRLAQYLKTEALVQHPEDFAIVLHAEIEKFQRAAAKEDYQPTVRLNVTSDFRPQTFEGIINAFPGVMFYDYTKLPSNSIAPNHHLTYSSTGASQIVNGKVVVNKESNWDKMVDDRLTKGMNVAMAFTSRTAMPKFILDERTGQRFQVWDGDNYDARFLDPKPGQPGNELSKGMIVGLTNKDKTTKPEDAAVKHNGFFLDYDPDRDGDTLVIKNQKALASGGRKTIPVKIAASRQRQTDTPQFKRWFGDSKVVDTNGQPLVVYHGTDISADDTEERGGGIAVFRDFQPIWFAEDPYLANLYVKYDDEASAVYPAYVSIKKPFVIEQDLDGPISRFRNALYSRLGLRIEDFGFRESDQSQPLYSLVNTSQFAQVLQDKGYDGIVANERDYKTYAALDARQVKSATGNSGEFDAESQDITASRQRGTSWRDETGRLQFAPGAAVYRVVADVANNVLDRIGLKPISTDLGRAMRKMKVEVEKAQNLTVDVAEKLKALSEDERKMISDVIEGELKAGVTPPQKILDLAAAMQTIMSEQSAELVRLGMISPEAAGRWEGKYLPRFYETKIKDEAKGWAKAALELVRKPRTMQGIRGNSLKSRGIFKTIDASELEQWTADGWEQRDPGFNPAKDRETVVWRDFTREERQEMGEIRDAMFRFVMGYNSTQRDIALGRLYERIAQDMGSRVEREGYVQVPETKVTDTQARRYGALAGMYVPKEVMDHLSAFDGSMQNELVKLYLSALSKWKEGKTVLNPVSHANNILSNLTMAHFAGVSYWDAPKYAAAVRDLMRDAPMVKEAQDAGLFLGTFSRADLLKDMPEQLKVLAGASDSKLTKAGNTVWSAMSFFLNKPLGKAYDAEDQFFRYLIYRDARNRGLEADDAVEYAQRFIFTYDDLPKTARLIRDTALPFFSYTYKVVPALASTALEHPIRFAAPAAVLYTVNAMFYAMAQAAGEGEDDDWYEAMRRYITDPKFRERTNALEQSERANLPEWMKGMSATLGTPKAIRLGMDEVTNLPLFLDVSKIFPGGDLLDAVNNAGGVAMLQPLTPSSPLFTTFGAMMLNKDAFQGKEVTKGSDTQGELVEKRGEWLWRQFSPALAVGNYHWERTMNALANAVGEPIMGYTGFGKDGLPVQPGLAAAQTVGIKVRPIDLEMSEKIEQADRRRLIRELDAEIRRLNQLEARGAITPDNAEAQRELQREKRIRLREGLTVDGEER